MSELGPVEPPYEDDREPRRVWCRGCNAEAFIPHPGTTEQGRKACREVDERCTCEAGPVQTRTPGDDDGT